MAIQPEFNITTIQEVVLLNHLHDPHKDVIFFKWMLATETLEIEFIDQGGNRFYRSFNKLGHFKELI